MDMIIYPSILSGGVKASPSKSYTHRYFFISLLSKGRSIILNPLRSRDTQATLNTVRAFGSIVKGNYIDGCGELKTPNDKIDCIRSGTTCRFATAISGLVKGPVVLTGNKQLTKRPMKDLIIALENMGVKIRSNNHHLPLTVWGGDINNRSIEISGRVSSQFTSALLLLGLKTGIEIVVKNDLKSRGYVDITLNVIREAGGKYYRDDYKYFKVFPNEVKPGIYKVPGDYSSSAYLIAAAAIKGHIKIIGLRKDDPQPDRKIIDIVKKMGAEVSWRGEILEVSSGELEGIDVDCSDSPDLLPIVSVLGAFAKGKTLITGALHSRYKESDRIKASLTNLRRMGVYAHEYRDGLEIYGGISRRGTIFTSYNDHRIVLAFMIASLFMRGRSIIRNIDVVDDSYPSFFKDLKSLGGRYVLV